MVQWLGLQAPNAGVRVQSLVRELDPTCCTKKPYATTQNPELPKKKKGCISRDLTPVIRAGAWGHLWAEAFSDKPDFSNAPETRPLRALLWFTSSPSLSRCVHACKVASVESNSLRPYRLQPMHTYSQTPGTSIQQTNKERESSQTLMIKQMLGNRVWRYLNYKPLFTRPNSC